MRSSDDSPILELVGARLGYPGKLVLDSVDLRIERGQFWFVLGPNGSGKTTLLRALLGLLEPLDGRVIRDRRRAARSRIGFVPQQCAFSPALPTTIREFVSLGAVGGDRPAESRAEDLAWALDRAQLSGMADRDYWSLSGGQRQRTLVARALVRRPSVLILDEATEGMDLRSRDEFLDTLEDLHQESASTLVFVTHHIELAARHATHVALVNAGGVVSGPVGEMLEAEALAEAFGKPGAAFARALAESRSLESPA